MKELIIIAFKDTSSSEVYKRCKSIGFKYRRKLVQIDNVIFSTVLANNVKCFNKHESGIKVIDFTLANYDNGVTLMEKTIDKYKLRIN